jgi:DNA-binding transcriptional MerR regulator
MERPLTVGQLARATGVPAKTIRYYEQVGVLPVPRRSEAGYRHYSRHDVHRLLFIRRARALGLSLATLKALTAELDSGECLTMRPRLHALVTEQLHTVQQPNAKCLSSNWRRCSNGSRQPRPRRMRTGVNVWMVTPQRNGSHANPLAPYHGKEKPCRPRRWNP